MLSFPAVFLINLWAASWNWFFWFARHSITGLVFGIFSTLIVIWLIMDHRFDLANKAIAKLKGKK